MLTAAEKKQIRDLMQSPQWQTLERVAEIIKTNFQVNSTIRDTEWETLKAVCIQEGKIKGISEFFQELYKQISE